jgi:hypothetical protein
VSAVGYLRWFIALGWKCSRLRHAMRSRGKLLIGWWRRAGGRKGEFAVLLEML